MRVHVQPRPALVRAAALVMGALAITLGLTTTQAGSPAAGWRVGQPMELPVSVPAAALDAARAKGIGLLRAAGVAASGFQTSRAYNQYDYATEDTTIALDARGRAVATLTEDIDHGSIRSLVRYDKLGASRSGDPTKMPAHAASILGAVGIPTPASSADVGWDDGMGAWSVGWRRVIDGVVAPRDGLTVWVTPTGELRAIGNRETSVSRGSRSIDETGARDRVRAFLNGNPISKQARLTTVSLEWEQPNDFVTPAKPDSADPTLRLVHAVSYVIDLDNGLHSEGVLWVDAETGDLVGGSDLG